MSDECEAWYRNLQPEAKKRAVGATIELLEDLGPALARPRADTVKGSRFKNMKELRVGTIRLLYIFDPLRRGILLIGGDKRNRWQQWYDENIPIADAIYAQHLTDEGLNDR